MKILKNIMIIGLSVMIILAAFINVKVYATDFNWGTALTNADNAVASSANDSAKTIIGSAVTIVRTACVGVAVFMIVILAVKYMSSAPNEKASFAKSSIQYIIGALVLFASSAILTIIGKFANTAVTTMSSKP